MHGLMLVHAMQRYPWSEEELRRESCVPSAATTLALAIRRVVGLPNATVRTIPGVLSTDVPGGTLPATRTLLPSNGGYDVKKRNLAKSVTTSNLEGVPARITFGILTDGEVSDVGFKTIGTGKLK